MPLYTNTWAGASCSSPANCHLPPAWHPSDPSNTNFKHLGLGLLGFAVVAWAVVQVVVFHGNKRTADPAELAEADVVLTTYSIIEGEHRRYVEPDKIPCKYCNKRFQPDRLEVHLRYSCHPAGCLAVSWVSLLVNSAVSWGKPLSKALCRGRLRARALGLPQGYAMESSIAGSDCKGIS